MVGWHHWLSGHGFGWTPGVGDGQGVLAYCGSWGCKESYMTEWLTELRRVWPSALANMLQYSCLENPRSVTETPGRPQSAGLQRAGPDWSDPACVDSRRVLPVAALPQGKLSLKAVQLLGLWGPWWRQVCRDTDLLQELRPYSDSLFSSLL